MFSRMVFRISVFILATAAAAQAQSEAPMEHEAASKLFGLKEKGCSSCHTIGSGDKTGPDLKGVTQRRERAWVKRFVNAPAEVISSGDETAVELFKKFKGVTMANQGLTDEEFERLWAYWTYCDGEKSACIPYDGPKWGLDVAIEAEEVATAQEGEARKAEEAKIAEGKATIAQGEALYTGAKFLSKGGPSCFGCHHVRGVSIWGGGSVGPDLTFAYARLGENKLVPALEEMSSPVMKLLYEKAPLTSEEQYQIKAFLASVSRDGTIPEPMETNFLFLGLEGMGLVVGVALVFWSRKRGNA
ncbi:MAG: cytochrome c [Proteobacteria bacterium]|nr:cytochrome c [Cystobacterineae bacterium]MCL2258297.1 cytochrome c [Cystobacterineae bacterium]MCL2315071.1 cytochrome c [Pseudomonadota bacterium]